MYSKLLSITPYRFEELCFHLLREMHRSSEIKKVEGSGGDEGVDTFQGIFRGEVCVWQCKCFVPRFTVQHRSKVLDSLRTAVKKIGPQRWVLCIPVDMDTKSHKWFQKLKKAYEKKVNVDLLQGSEIIHQLLYRHNIRREFFPDLGDKFDELRAALVGKGEADEDQLRKLSVTDIERYVAKLEERDPRFTYRVTFPQESSTTAQETTHRDLGNGHMATMLDDTLRVDIFVRDKGAVEADPPKFNLTVRGTGVEKFLQSIKTGEQIELSSDEVVGLSSNWALFPTETKLTRFILSPSTELQKKNHLLRVCFELEEKKIVYEAIEFRAKRAGTDEIEFVSNDDDLPFEMRLTYRKSGSGGLIIQNRWIGREIRIVKKACDAVALLMGGGHILFHDLKRGVNWGTGDADFSHPDDLRTAGQFVEDLLLVANSFGLELQYPPGLKKQDAVTLELLLKIIRTGKLPLTNKVFDCEFVKSTENSEPLSRIIGDPQQFRITRTNLEPTPVFLGHIIDTGPCVIESVARVKEPDITMKKFLDAQVGEPIRLSFEILEEPTLLFERFTKVVW